MVVVEENMKLVGVREENDDCRGLAVASPEENGEDEARYKTSSLGVCLNHTVVSLHHSKCYLTKSLYMYFPSGKHCVGRNEYVQLLRGQKLSNYNIIKTNKIVYWLRRIMEKYKKCVCSEVSIWSPCAGPQPPFQRPAGKQNIAMLSLLAVSSYLQSL